MHFKVVRMHGPVRRQGSWSGRAADLSLEQQEGRTIGADELLKNPGRSNVKVNFSFASGAHGVMLLACGIR